MAQDTSTGYSPCLLAQEAIDAKFNGLNPGTISTDTGMLNALVSPVNTGARSFNPLPERALPTADGKVKITASYLPFACDESSVEPIDDCDVTGGATPSYLYEDFYIDSVSTVKFTLKDEEFRSMCESAGTQLNDMIVRETDKLLRIINKKSILQSTALFGTYPGTAVNSYANPATLQVVNGSMLYNPQMVAVVKGLYSRMQLGDITPMMVGAGYTDYIAFLRNISGVSDDGINRASTFGLENFFRDSQLDSVLPALAPGLLTWAPGAMQLLTWNKNVGPQDYSTPLNRLSAYDGIGAATTAYEKQFTTLNVNGLLVDFFYTYNCGVHSFAMQLHHSVVGLPATAFADCQTYNFALAFQQACGTLDCTTLAQFEVED